MRSYLTSTRIISTYHLYKKNNGGNNAEAFQNYHIFYGGAGENAPNKNQQADQHYFGGVAIVIKSTLVRLIKPIRRINERVTDIRLNNCNIKKRNRNYLLLRAANRIWNFQNRRSSE